MLVIILVFLVCLFGHSFCSCPHPWRTSSLNPNACYLVVIEQKTWSQAESYCNGALSGAYPHLTSITSAYENNYVDAITIDTHSISSCDNLWIGANDLDQVGRFTWINGEPYQYASWNSGQPDLSKQCVSSQARTTGRWQTEPCETTRNCFICQNINKTSSASSSSLSTTTMTTTTTPMTTTTTPMTTATSSSISNCPNGWKYFQQTNSCYQVFRQESIWYVADEYCLAQQKGRHLTSIHSREENDFIVRLAQDILAPWNTQFTWIGLNDIANFNIFKWSDRSRYDYSNWAPGEPFQQQGQENCVVLAISENLQNPPNPPVGTWKDIPCGTSGIPSFICKMPSF